MRRQDVGMAGYLQTDRYLQTFIFNIYLNYDSFEMDIKVLKRHDRL